MRCGYVPDSWTSIDVLGTLDACNVADDEPIPYAIVDRGELVARPTLDLTACSWITWLQKALAAATLVLVIAWGIWWVIA
ncbi:hypothetical protein G4X40_20330 [Rhodococcus sp. D2-41]|uniref:hypothetical protein n=1 Tax=Speluncibacter jeojiensis TaxID=2710754 RepID=UPI00240FC0AB|nr:hypothetical protein [Rhodococcus sp. D2-41]MDG3012491.1 hypothetical protein [Rhodococcus sp. D2-41]